MGSTSAGFQKTGHLGNCLRHRNKRMHYVINLKPTIGRADCYPVEEVVPPHCSHMVAVIQQSEVALRRPVKLADLDVSKPADELPPDLGSDPIANGYPHFVDVVIGFLFREGNSRSGKLITFSIDATVGLW